MIRLLTVAARLTMMGVVAIPAVGFGEANDPKERDALARALPQAQVPLARGLSASARERERARRRPAVGEVRDRRRRIPVVLDLAMDNVRQHGDDDVANALLTPHAAWPPVRRSARVACN
jgi:hypothetical protein